MDWPPTQWPYSMWQNKTIYKAMDKRIDLPIRVYQVKRDRPNNSVAVYMLSLSRAANNNINKY